MKVDELKINGFVLRYFPVIAYILMTNTEFTTKELLRVFSKGVVYGFISSGVHKGVLEKIARGKYRLKIDPNEIRITKGEVNDGAMMVRNGLTLVIV